MLKLTCGLGITYQLEFGFPKAEHILFYCHDFEEVDDKPACTVNTNSDVGLSASKKRKMKTCILITCLVLCSVSTIPVASDGGKLYLDCLFYPIEHLTDNTVFRITLPWVYL